MSTCPKCSGTELRHTLVAGTLPAHSCYRCKGILVSLVAYRGWRERSGISKQSGKDENAVAPVKDTKDAVLCTKCRNLMTKYRISADAPNRIDFCSRCEDVWLDGGEWELVEALVGSDHLANITTQPWQYRLMSDSVRKMEVERLKKELGADYERVVNLSEFLDGHPARLEILAYLSSRSR